MKILTTISLLAFFIGCNSTKKAQTKTTETTTAKVETKTNAKTVDFVKANEMKTIVSFLASDDLKGRNTGSEGINEAANYIENKFKTYGLKPYFDTYRDNFTVGNMDAFNVVGYLEGTDAKLKDEFIIIGAHYDHIGTAKDVNGDTIANGANDNAAGTSGVLSLVKYFSEKKTNKRSIMFTTFSAEEKGLLGSKHLAKKLKEKGINLYAMVNLEMIGVPFKDRDYKVFVTGFDKSNMAQKMNDYLGAKVVGFSQVSKNYNLFRQSDNYAFYKEFNLPSHTISSCDLSNYDYYHHVDDEVDKLDYNHMADLMNSIIPALETMSNTPTKEIVMNE